MKLHPTSVSVTLDEAGDKVYTVTSPKTGHSLTLPVKYAPKKVINNWCPFLGDFIMDLSIADFQSWKEAHEEMVETLMRETEEPEYLTEPPEVRFGPQGD